MAQLQLTSPQELSSPTARIPKGGRGLLLLTAVALAGGFICGLVTVYGELWLGFFLLSAGGFIIAALERPSVGVLIIIGGLYLLPFGIIPIPVGPFHLSFLDASLTVMLLAWGLRLMTRPQQSFVLSPVGAPALLFMGVALVALVFGIASAKAEAIRLFLKMINSVFFFFTVINCLRTSEEVQQAARMIPLGAGAAAALSVVLYLLPSSVSLQLLTSLGWLGYPTGDAVLRYIADTPILRATGTAIDPNVLGGMLLIALPLTISQLLERRPLLPRSLLIVIVLAMVWALLLTYSRSAWLGVFAGLLFLAFLRYKKLWVLLGLALALLLVLPQGRAFVQRFESGVFFADRAAQMRLGEYQDALRLISQYPIFGVGFGSAPRLDLYVATSSIYLLLAEQMGLVGLGMLLLTLSVFFWTAYRYRHAAQEQGLESIRLGALGGVLGALAAGFFDHYFFNIAFPHAIALFWLFVGLATATVSLTPREKAVKTGA